MRWLGPPAWVLALVLVIGGAAVPAAAQEAEPVKDVFSTTLRKQLARQDRLAQEGDFETLIEEAEGRLSDPTPDNYYLLGRAYGNAALRKRAEKEVEEYDTLLGDARKAFGKAKEVGGLLYAPAHLGLARCELFENDYEAAEIELRKSLEIEPVFREAVILLAQLLWERRLQSDAEFELYTYLQKNPGDVHVRSLLGMFKMKRKRWAEAEAEFAAVLLDEPDDLVSRKGIGTAIMFQRRYEEAAEHLERVRAAEPKQDDVYMTLFHVYRQLHDTEKARRVLEAALEQLAGTEVARRAADRLKEIDENPEAWAKPEMSVEELVAGLDSPNEAVVLKTLLTMQTMQWRLLPADVYRLLKTDVAGPKVRRHAVRLIGQVPEPRALTILEIKLYHPTERDPDADVRRETAIAVAKLPTPATLLILWDALHEDDVAIRETAVQGIARRTGKWFRADLEKRTEAKDWPAELERYEKWWPTGSASIRKREAVTALEKLYSQIRDRDRIAGYLLDVLDDRNPKTWRRAYDVFREWTFTSFLDDDAVATVSLETRQQVAAEARAWHAQRMKEKAAPAVPDDTEEGDE